MIIDRRLSGPSLFIPMLGMLEVNPARQTVYCAAADRKDFYHQLGASASKSRSNALGLPGLHAFGLLLDQAVDSCPCGDFAPAASDCASRSPLLFDADHYLVCFGAIAQGDHLGVEVGSAARENLLISGGCLPCLSGSALTGLCVEPQEPKVWFLLGECSRPPGFTYPSLCRAPSAREGHLQTRGPHRVR